jgi:hypothetical protein
MKTQRFIRKLHLWVGAWGAVAAVIFGFTGFIQNHRAVLKLPQGDATEVAKVELAVPERARATPESLRAWLHEEQHLSIDNVRVQPGRPIEFNGAKIPQPAHWNFVGGNARKSVQGEYSVGAGSIVVRSAEQSPLATFTRLHKGVGGGLAWILLEDSFAIAMVCLGISGLLMWARGRSTRDMIFSVVGVAALLLVVAGGAAVL